MCGVCVCVLRGGVNGVFGLKRLVCACEYMCMDFQSVQ